MNYRATFERAGELVPDQLIGGNAHLLVARKVRVLLGDPMPRGAVIGADVGDTYAMANDSGIDPDLILAETHDGLADREVLAYSRGDFNINAVTMSAGVDPVKFAEILRAKGIVLLPSVT